jgi:hypothetical protein
MPGGGSEQVLQEPTPDMLRSGQLETGSGRWNALAQNGTEEDLSDYGAAMLLRPARVRDRGTLRNGSRAGDW